MKRRGKKLEPKLGLDMPYGELLTRLVHTDPREVEESIKRSKQKSPRGDSPNKKGPAKRRAQVNKT